ncbi:MAG TPA: glycosyl hydrolase 43 family protein [Firmicutes bacterium]|jgi:beta-xylosidase|uniref:glycoside hydrolase family 43 protein n=1 Tax=Petrimonas mucosa TaxID=1642646 RepID=UPI0017A145A8|nr:glycoside hydrolase 43 family protein [Petrimonas mucosa]MDD3561409.1 glycoside hydrolase 43 family protein [Petrimonas mucosa]HHX11152.1 glycosyl hydrolase 43 family protein [Bacillota bacterium]
MKVLFSFLLILLTSFSCKTQEREVTYYNNPIINADAPDPSITRNGDDFYLVTTTMHMMPGAPVMKSKDLVNWEIVSYVYESLHDTPKYDMNEGTVYGRGQWATSIRYHEGMFYLLFSPNDHPYSAYIYSTADPATEEWQLVSRTTHFHDGSLFFDDDGRVYVFYGTGELRELEPDLLGVKEDGVNMKIFERDEEETGLLEGSHVVKHNGKYYLMMISWPNGENRRQLCYRADNITGPYEKKVVLEDNFAGFPYVGQGSLIDDKNGNWYAIIFQDRGAIGRVPLLMPVRWEDGWPMLGDEEGKVPASGEIPLKPHPVETPIVGSDDFNDSELKMFWQWNHNPRNENWSLTERPGYLRLKTNRPVDNLYAAYNTLTQRMEGPQCKGVVSIDLSNMKDGDVTGLSAFNGHSGLLSVIKEGDRKYLTMSTNVVELSNREKAILNVIEEEKERIEWTEDEIYLRVDCDFNLHKDIATFYYSADNENWTKIGEDYKMRFDYRKLFMGTRFAIFNYATKESGGYVDIDFFNYVRIL